MPKKRITFIVIPANDGQVREYRFAAWILWCGLLTAVGFCGAFTTFSTFSLDNQFLYRSHRGQMSFNMIAQVVVGLAAVSAGWYAGQWVAA